jgi:tetratricopeptide (TPR) repeat protein
VIQNRPEQKTCTLDFSLSDDANLVRLAIFMTKSAHTSTIRSDDRNLVDISTDQQSVTTLEDRVYILWQRYSRAFILLLVLVIIAVIGYFVLQWQKAATELAIQEEFQAATTVQQQKEFAARHPKHVLAGVVWKEQGDLAYLQSDYATAAEYLGKAAEVLPALIADQAKLGAAVSQLQIPEQQEKAILALQAIGENPNSYSILAAQAFWHLALHAWSRGDVASVNRYLDLVAEKDPSGVFSSEIAGIRILLPSPSDS